MAIQERSTVPPHQRLAETYRQAARTARAERTWRRQRAMLLQLLAESMMEFGISDAELAVAREAINENGEIRACAATRTGR